MQGLDKYDAWKLPDTAFEVHQEWIDGVIAYKSYFWFGDVFAALGCGVTNLRPELGSEIRTTIDQTLMIDPSTDQSQLHAGNGPIKLKARNEMKSVRIANNGFVYEILPGETADEVWLSLEHRPTRWNELNIQNPDVPNKSESENIFQLWINHGNKPEDARYGYLVYCGDTTEGAPLVVQNTKSIQAMCSADSVFIQAIFYIPDTLYFGEDVFYVSAPCAFSASIDDTSITFNVADAMMDVDLDHITVTTNVPLRDAISSKGLFSVEIALPVGHYRGRQSTKTLMR
jgi:hypothetical protein